MTARHVVCGILISGSLGLLAERSFADECQKLVDYFPTAVDFAERTCKHGPQPPRYHSCLSQRGNVELMAKKILACRGLTADQRKLYAAYAKRHEGTSAEADRQELDARARFARDYYRSLPYCAVGRPVNGLCVVP